MQQTSPIPDEKLVQAQNSEVSNSIGKNEVENKMGDSRVAKTKPPPYIPPPKVSKPSEKVNPDDLLVKDLIQLLKLQREKIVNQQNDLAKVHLSFFHMQILIKYFFYFSLMRKLFI